MSNPTQEFKRTGKNVSVSRDELVHGLFAQFSKFDAMTPEQKKMIINPYVSPVNVALAGGKMVQVPKNIQDFAISKWRAMQESALSSPHTRIDRRKRYTGSDPHIMNDELKSIVPNEVYGSGGSMGDLPRDFVLFDRMIDRNVDDMPYKSNKNTFGRVNPVGFYAIDDQNYIRTQDQYDAIARERVNMADRMSHRRHGGCDSDRQPRRFMGYGGPANSDMDDDGISPVESEMGPDHDMHKSAVHENYASVADEPIEYGPYH